MAELPVPKTIEGLREALFDEINSIRSGAGNLQRARAVAQLAAQSIDAIRVQIQYGRMLLAATENGSKSIPLGVEAQDARRARGRGKS